MVLRGIVAVIGILVLLIGMIGMMYPDRLVDFTTGMMRPSVLRVLAVFELLLGMLLVVAGLGRLVAMSTFVLLMGTYLVALSIVTFVAPGRMIEMVRTIFLDAPPATQAIVLWVSGLLRIFIGGALFWAGVRPRPVVAAAPVEHR